MHTVLTERILWVRVQCEDFKNQDPPSCYCGGKTVILIHWRVPETTDENHVIKKKKKVIDTLSRCCMIRVCNCILNINSAGL